MDAGFDTCSFVPEKDPGELGLTYMTGGPSMPVLLPEYGPDNRKD